MRKSKISPRCDGPFQIINKINDNAYQLDLLADYDVHSTFNIFDLIPFVGYVDDDEHQNLRTNPFQVGGDDGSTLGLIHGPYAP